MDDSGSADVLCVRLIMERPDAHTLDGWRARIERFGLVIDAQNERSIDAHGARERIEQALAVRIELVGGKASVVAGPDVHIGQSEAPVSVYIPRKPSIF